MESQRTFLFIEHLNERFMPIALCFLLIIAFLPAGSAAVPPGYRDRATLLQDFFNLMNQYPTLMTYESIGKSYQGRDIPMFMIGNPNGGKVLFTMTTHGDEVQGAEVGYYMAEWILQRKEPAIAERILQSNLIMIVIENIDSYGIKRKNMNLISYAQGTDPNLYGVDLNRNMPTGWGGSDSSKNAADMNYEGPSPGSEPESQALIRVFQTYKPKFQLNYHYGGGMVFGKPSGYAQMSSSMSQYHDVTANKIKALAASRGVDVFGYGQLGISGCVTDQAYVTANSTSYLLENGNWPAPPYNQIESVLMPRLLPFLIVFAQESEVVGAATRITFADGFESGSFSAWNGTYVTPGETATVVKTLAYQGSYSANFTSNGTDGFEGAYFSDGFESGAFGAWTSTSGSPTLQSATVHTGTCAMKATGSATQTATKTIAVVSTVNGRCYVYFDSLPSSGNYLDFLEMTGGGGCDQLVGVYNSGGTVRWCLRRSPWAAQPEKLASSGPSTGVWYCVELSVSTSASSPYTTSETVWVGGAQITTDTYNAGAGANIGSVKVGADDKTAALTNYVDDVVVSPTYIGPQPPRVQPVTICYEPVPASSRLYAGGYFYVSQSGIAENDDRFYLIEFLAGSNGVAYAGWRRIGGVDLWSLIIRDATGWASANSSFSPSLNEWHSVELYWAEGAADGRCELYVDGRLACSVQNQNTTAFGNIDQVRFGLAEIYGAGPTTIYADSFRILGTPPWDINQDGVVNVHDLAILAAAYGSTPSSPNWNPAADINADGKVDVRDLVMFALHYGEQYG